MSITQFRQLVVPAAVVAESERMLRRWRKRETVIYWVGIGRPDIGVVTSVIRPQQVNTSGSYDVSSRANADIAVWLCDHKLELLAQLHTHPGSFVGHSPGDDLGAPLAFDGFYSIVVPSYGRVGIRPLAQCGVHVYCNAFLKLPAELASEKIQIVPHAADFLV